MRELIDSREKLEELLYLHTGSKRITDFFGRWALEFVEDPTYTRGIKAIAYETYSRGKTTMMFCKNYITHEVLLINIWPKLIWSAKRDGINNRIFQALAPLIQNNSTLIASTGGFLLYLNQPLTEQQITDYFKLGFNYYSHTSIDTVLEMN